MEHTITGKRFSIKEMFEFSWKFFTKNWQELLTLIVVVYLPFTIAYAWLTSWMASYAEDLTKQGVSGSFPSISIGLILGIIIAYIAIIIVMTLMSMAATIFVADRIAGKMTTWQDSYSRALKRLPIAIGTMLLMGVLLLLLTFLLVIPAIIFSVFWTFAIYVVTLKDMAWMAALRDSKKIVQGRWWTVVGYSIVFAVIASLVGSAISLVVSIPFMLLKNVFITSLITQLASVVVVAYFIVLSIVFYLNFDANRIRKVEENTTATISEEA